MGLNDDEAAKIIKSNRVQHKKVALFSYRFSYKDFGLCSCIGRTKWFYNQLIIIY